MINFITTELKDYKISYDVGRFSIELEYALEAGSFPNFGRNGRITLIFRKSERFTNHFVRYNYPDIADRSIVFFDQDEYLPIVDLLRNESPVYFHCRIDYRGRDAIPNGRHEIRRFSLSTDKEQIGEDDLDEST